MFYPVYHSFSYNFQILSKSISISFQYWSCLKLINFLSTSITWCFLAFHIDSKMIIPPPINNQNEKQSLHSNFFLTLGKDIVTGEEVILPEKGLYQNILVTGTIGTGKTSSALYPFTKQLMSYGLGMLILDVKGNYHQKVQEFAKEYHREIKVIELGRQRNL